MIKFSSRGVSDTSIDFLVMTMILYCVGAYVYIHVGLARLNFIA